MATIIQIKRSSGSTAPTTSDLAEGELAYAQDQSGSGAAAKLYIESLDSDGTTPLIHTIGGKYYTDAVDAATDSNTASTIVKRDASGDFSAGAITFGDLNDGTITIGGFVDEDNMASDSATLVPTQQSVKAYVDSQVGGVSSNINLVGDSGTDTYSTGNTLTFTGGTGVATTVSDDEITFAIGQAVGTGDSVTFAAVTADLTGDVTGNADTATALATARTIGGVSFDGTANISLPGVDTTGNQDTSGNAATATALETARTINGVSFDGTANITTLTAGTGVTVSGTEVAIGQAVGTGDNVTFNDISAGGNVTVTGNLTVNGTTTTVATTNTVVSDTLLELGNGTSSAANDSGIVIERGSTGDNAFMGWDESADKFTMGTTTATGSSTGDLTITVGTLVANIEGNVTGNITGDVTGSLSGGTVSGLSAAIGVADGGTGAGTFTSNGIIYGNGTGALQATAAGTDGYILYSNSGTPDWTNTLDGGSY
jgi:hypothetical protein